MENKRYLKVIFYFAFLFSIIPILGIKAEANDIKKSCGYYTYVEYEGGAWIVGYNDGKNYYKEENIIWEIPSTLNGLKVIGLGDYYKNFYEIEFNSNIGQYASTIILPDTLLYIGSYAFKECSRLKNITIPSSIKSVGYCAFFKCDNLTSVVFPEGLESIGYMAFNGCKSIEVINIPASVTSIGQYAFFDCWNVSGIYVDEKNTAYFDLDGVLCKFSETWYEDAEGNLQYIDVREIITYPSGKKGTFHIEEDMYVDPTTFVNAKKLSGITVEETNLFYTSKNGILYDKDMTEIKICPSAKTGKVVIPDTVTRIGYSAFSYSAVTEIVIPDSVTFIDSYSFYMCEELQRITIGKNLINPETGRDVLDYLLEQLSEAKKLSTVEISSEHPQMKSIDGIVYNKDVTELLFCPMNKSGVYIMPDTVVSATKSIFISGFEEITIGASYVGELVGSKNIKKLNISDKNNKYVLRDELVYSKDMKTIYLIPSRLSGKLIIPDGVTTILDGNAIVDFEGSIVIPKSVCEISGADSWHTYIEDSPVTIYGYNDTYAEEYAKEYNIPFVYLTTELKLNSSAVTMKIGDKKTLTVTISPENVVNAQIKWSSDNTKVATVDENGNVTAVAEGTANVVVMTTDGTNLKAQCVVTVEKRAELPKVGTKISLASGYYKVIKSSDKSKEVTYIKPKNNEKTIINIPNIVKIDGYTYNVTGIADKALKNNTKIKSVTIGKNVKKIGKYAFYNCKKLKKITIKSAGLKTVGKSAIKNIDKKATIKVPKKQLSKYKKLFDSKTGFKKTMKIKK